MAGWRTGTTHPGVVRAIVSRNDLRELVAEAPGLTAAEVASRLGRTPRWCQNNLGIMEAAGEMSCGQACRSLTWYATAGITYETVPRLVFVDGALSKNEPRSVVDVARACGLSVEAVRPKLAALEARGRARRTTDKARCTRDLWTLA